MVFCNLYIYSNSVMVACKILVIEDDIDDIVILHEAFDKKGMAADLFFIQNPETTLTYLESLSDYALPHLIISDLNMPKLDGFELLKLLKDNDRFHPIPVILFSTYHLSGFPSFTT